MYWKPPKNSDKFYWTQHVQMKMQHYGLSEQRIRRVIKQPERTEEGVAKNTIAVMQPQSTRRGDDGEKTWKQEIWVMYVEQGSGIKGKNSKSQIQHAKQEAGVSGKAGEMIDAYRQILGGGQKLKVISAWRYPGRTKPGESLPEEILAEIAEVDC